MTTDDIVDPVGKLPLLGSQRFGNFGFSLESQFFGYPATPKGGPSWSARLDVKVLFRRGFLRERILNRAPDAPLPPG